MAKALDGGLVVSGFELSSRAVTFTLGPECSIFDSYYTEM